MKHIILQTKKGIVLYSNINREKNLATLWQNDFQLEQNLNGLNWMVDKNEDTYYFAYITKQ